MKNGYGRRAILWMLLLLLVLLLFGALVFYLGADRHLNSPRMTPPAQAHSGAWLRLPG